MGAAEAGVARRRLLPWALGAGAAVAAVLVALLGTLAALVGGELGCLGGRGDARQPAPSRSALREIPPDRLRLYREAGLRFRIDWAFLASIGAQECGHGACPGDNGSGCAGPMQIAVRRGSPCSPGTGPTLWESYGVDADRDGRTHPNDPADAVFTAARILRRAKGAPPTGGSHAAYRRAACNYYGALRGRLGALRRPGDGAGRRVRLRGAGAHRRLHTCAGSRRCRCRPAAARLQSPRAGSAPGGRSRRAAWCRCPPTSRLVEASCATLASPGTSRCWPAASASSSRTATRRRGTPPTASTRSAPPPTWSPAAATGRGRSGLPARSVGSVPAPSRASVQSARIHRFASSATTASPTTATR
jgi:hypothetical protein